MSFTTNTPTDAATVAPPHAEKRAMPTLPSLPTLLAALRAIETAVLPAAEAELAAVAAAQRNGVSIGGPITPFHSCAVPGITLADYALHVANRTGYGTEGLAAGIALMARFGASTGRGLTPLAMHRLFATCMQVGMKAASDVFVKNVYVAPICGMTLDELNHLEATLVAKEALDFRCIPSNVELCDFPRALAQVALRRRRPLPTRNGLADEVQRMVANYAFAPNFLEQAAPPPITRSTRRYSDDAAATAGEPLALPTVLLDMCGDHSADDSNGERFASSGDGYGADRAATSTGGTHRAGSSTDSVPRHHRASCDRHLGDTSHAWRAGCSDATTAAASLTACDILVATSDDAHSY